MGPSEHEAIDLSEYLRDPRCAITEDGVLCLECGRRFRHLTNTHLRSHGLTSDDYKQRFGYNMRRALMSSSVRRTTPGTPTRSAWPTASAGVPSWRTSSSGGRAGATATRSRSSSLAENGRGSDRPRWFATATAGSSRRRRPDPTARATASGGRRRLSGSPAARGEVLRALFRASRSDPPAARTSQPGHRDERDAIRTARALHGRASRHGTVRTAHAGPVSRR